MTRHNPRAGRSSARRTVGRRVLVAMLGVVLGIVGLAGVSSPAHANGTVDAFVNRWNGSYADYDGAYGAQCVDLFNYYNRDVVKAPRIAVNYAAQLFGAAPSSHYEKLSPGVTPRKGDVAVWGTSWPYTSAGHVAIVLGDQGGNISVLSAALLGKPTGATRDFIGDVAATAKRDLNAGERLDGEGGYTVYGRLMPARDSLAAAALPIGLAHDVTLRRSIRAGEVVSWDDVDVDTSSEAARARRDMEARFAGANDAVP